jgi:CelD/BcsL family acetyltransferase involved in cellulose biosynthesis
LTSTLGRLVEDRDIGRSRRTAPVGVRDRLAAMPRRLRLRAGSPSGPASDVVVEPVHALEALREEWSVLGERTGNLFATWEWASIWWKHLGAGRPLLAAACRDASGAMVGLLPAYVALGAGPLRVIRLLGHGQGDRLGPICLPADRLRVGAALQVALRAKPWTNALILAEHLPAEEEWKELLGARRLGRDASPLLEISTQDWEHFLGGLSTHLRKQIRYQERRLAREHAVRYRLVTDKAELPAALDAMFELHGTRWGPHGATEFALARGFHGEFAARALERDWLRLWLLEVDGRAVAAWYGFRFANADWHYQSGRDPSWDRLSVGAILLAHTIRDCVESGISRYHFLRGGESYKLRFATCDPGLETIAVGTGLIGRSELAAANVVNGLPTSARRRLARVIRA